MYSIPAHASQINLCNTCSIFKLRRASTRAPSRAAANRVPIFYVIAVVAPFFITPGGRSESSHSAWKRWIYTSNIRFWVPPNFQVWTMKNGTLTGMRLRSGLMMPISEDCMGCGRLSQHTHIPLLTQERGCNQASSPSNHQWHVFTSNRDWITATNETSGSRPSDFRPCKLKNDQA